MNTEQILKRAQELKSQGSPFALVTVVRSEHSTSAKPGAKALVEPDGKIQGWVGGGCAQPVVIKTANQALKDGQARLIRISPEPHHSAEEGIEVFSMSCFSGGVLDIFIDPIMAKPGLLVLGTSPVAYALVDLASRLNFSVTLVTPEPLPEIISGAATQTSDMSLTHVTPAAAQFVVVSSQGNKDEACLEAALSTGSQWVAFIASDRKANRMREYLIGRKHKAEAVAAIQSPAGLQIGAKTPEEIALSVLTAAIKAYRIDKTPIPERRTTLENVDAATKSCCGVTGAAQATVTLDPVCQMEIKIDSADFTASYHGKTYYFCCKGCQRTFEKTPKTFVKEATV